ncbi:phosphomannomutase/phosphoglucomutase, partial [Candidatus Berkelbacteria bacterium]|nr:phosphomannomutase/phosphoglucomutase [Candidatus Berkelbacteria bacterium]
SQVGWPYIKAKMREVGAIYGNEPSGHHYFRDFSYQESSMYAVLLLLSLLQQKKVKLSSLLHPLFSTYFFIDEQNVPLPSAQAIEETYQRLIKAFPEGQIDRLDGLSISGPDWYWNLRPSGGEPLLRLNCEAKSRAVLDSTVSRVTKLLTISNSRGLK